MNNLRNEAGKNLWNKTSSVVIGGCGLLSKRPTRYASRLWPAYFKKANKIKVQSIDGVWFKDFTEFAIGCCLLGYSNKNIIDKDYRFQTPMTTLLSPYEYHLATELNSFFGINFVWKFCRGGGEALAVAIRLARKIANNTKVLTCGYHGFHDWYLSSNIGNNSALNGTFLPNLNVDGIPREYANTCFSVGDFTPKSLSQSINQHNPGVVVVECARYELITQESVDILKRFQEKGGIVVVDEVTSGFRFRNKLAAFEVKLQPDLVVLGKSLGNGFAISAVGGRSEHLYQFEQCFLSSTHWTEEIGLKAGTSFLKAIGKWDNFFDKLEVNSNYLKSRIIHVLTKKSLKFRINSLSTMISFEVEVDGLSSQNTRLLLMAEMLSYGYLFNTTIYPTIMHSRREIDKYIYSLNRSINNVLLISKSSKEEIFTLLKNIGPVQQSFGRTQKL